MSLRDELLKPIAGSNPGGVDLRYDPVYDKIKEARREDDDAPQGEWATARKTADWPTVIKLAKDALSGKSKDLQIAAWLTEGLLRREGFAGLQAGLDVLTGLIEEHWDHLFPEIDDGDSEMRAAPLDWVGLKLEIPVRMVGLDRSGFTSFQHKEARAVPTEAAAAESEDKSTARQTAIAAGKKTPEDIDAAFTATPKPWFKALVADIEGSLATLAKLDQVSTEKFGDAAPTYGKLRETIQDVQRLAASQLKRKLEIEPDPVDLTAVAVADSGTASTTGAPTGGALAAEPASRDDATGRIIGAARYLRRTDPFNPAAYLLLRGLRWGELRASTTLDPKLLEAPPTNVRTMLKGLLLDARWPELLEAAEGVMGTGQGRGWLDLQRYALTACDALGSDYFAVGTAMRGALRSLLADLPQLLDMTLMDDTPTANAETRAWLRSVIVAETDAVAAPSLDASANGGAPDENGDARARDPFSLAAAEVRAGRADRAIALLMKEASREKTSRGRFLVQAQLARIMVDAGHEAVALPILERLISDVEAHKLEEWEAGDLVATPMALMYRVLTKTQADEATRQNLYLRICRLDPIQAISFSQS
jgi:type VI secretion system protein ImpA